MHIYNKKYFRLDVEIFTQTFQTSFWRWEVSLCRGWSETETSEVTFQGIYLSKSGGWKRVFLTYSLVLYIGLIVQLTRNTQYSVCGIFLVMKNWQIAVYWLLPRLPTDTAFSGIWNSFILLEEDFTFTGVTNEWWWKDNKWTYFGDLTSTNLWTALPNPFHMIWWDHSKIDSAC